MPHSTYNYPFEWVVFEAAERLCSGRSKFVHLDTDGRILTVTPAAAPACFAELEQWTAQGASFLFYDPFDAPEYTWIEWHRMNVEAMERMVGRPFQVTDFVPYSESVYRPKLDPPGAFPETWKVMY